MQFVSADTTIFSKNFKHFFCPLKHEKNCHQKLHIISPIFFSNALGCPYGQKLKIYIRNWSEGPFVIYTLILCGTNAYKTSNLNTLKSCSNDYYHDEMCLCVEYVHQGFHQVWYQGGVKATVSGVVEDPKFKISEGSNQFWSQPSEILILRSSNTQETVDFTTP